MRKLTAILLCLVLLVSVFSGCTDNSGNTEATKVTSTYVIALETAGGKPIEKVRVKVFDEANGNLINTAVTNGEGEISFLAQTGHTYNAVFEKMPGGYIGEKVYRISEERTVIVPSVGVMTETDFENVTYSLGDAVLDFSITAVDGTEYTLSKLLEKKKAVVLNFWYLECNPCKMEFPYMQEAYEEYSDDVELIAMNAVNTDADAVKDFQETNGYTFPMALCDSRWGAVIGAQAYPTTIVIDRYGNICLIHTGMVTEAESLKTMLDYFTSDSYEQEFFKTMSQIPA